MAVISLDGFYDLHIHTGPAPFKRSGDALDIGRWCAAEGMAGIVTKGHFESTIARAHHANKELTDYPNFKVFAAIALNRGVGGVNPGAVEIAMELGAKVVWLPTLDATNHAKAFGGGGTYGFKAMSLDFKRPSTFRDSYSVVDQALRLTTQAKEVIDIVNAYDAILATGHISRAEIEAVVDYSASVKLARVVVTHPEFTVPNLAVSTMIELTKSGAFMEFCATNCFPLVGLHTIDEMKAMIEEVGIEHCIISSDSGQPFHPRPPETLRSFIQTLHERGMPESAIRTMCVANPAFLVGAAPRISIDHCSRTKSERRSPAANPFVRSPAA